MLVINFRVFLMILYVVSSAISTKVMLLNSNPISFAISFHTPTQLCFWLPKNENGVYRALLSNSKNANPSYFPIVPHC